MNNNEQAAGSGQRWKPGHSFPQLLLHKHLFFFPSPYFSVLSLELLSHVDIWEVPPPPLSIYPIWLLYSHIFMTLIHGGPAY